MAILQIIENPEKQQWAALLMRPVLQTENLDDTVQEILEGIKKGGDKALNSYSVQFEQSAISDRIVSDKEFEAADGKLKENLKTAIREAKKNIELFHSKQLTPEPEVEVMPGIRCWRKAVSIEKVGLYIPGGTAPLFSTLLMLGVPAKLAGCEEIIVCTPPQPDGSIHPAILFTAALLGIRKIVKAGGAQAIAAMAYGTETIPKVDKIFGPGNQYVTHAKKIIQQEGVAIDMPAGPSELAIYADETAVAEFVAADLLSQCEHGTDSQVILVTASREFANTVNIALALQVEGLPRKSIARKSLENSKIFLLNDPVVSLDLLNTYAPEHLILACRDPEIYSAGVRNAGSVFLGNYAPESAGDYASGTNHTLPTNGFARAYSGVSVDSFVKKISFQQLTRNGLQSIRNSVAEMARAEGLQAHAAAVEIRFSTLNAE
jgi:histidinol dehydrogenase